MRKVTVYFILSLMFLWAGSSWGQTMITLGEGTGSNTTSGAPTPYGTYYKNFKQQYLILASELTAKGLNAGNITALAFNVANKNNCSAMPNYTIYIKATTLTALTATFEAGMYQQVWFNTNYLPTNGWNTHTFDNPYYWDGTSNIIVQICTDLIPGAYTNNASVYYTATTPNTALRAQLDSQIACDATTGTVSKNRANMQISWELATDPMLLTTPDFLSFGYVPSGSSSTLSYNLSGENLTDGPIIITAPANFTVSLSDEGPFSESVEVSYTPPTLNSTPIYIKFSPSGTAKDYSGNIANAGGSAVKNLPVTGTSKIQYCVAKGNLCDEFISNVTVGTINNSSGCSGGYSDYSDISTDMYVGISYPISVTNGPPAYNGDQCGIWVDWNNNGSFYDANETIMISNTMSGGKFLGTITPPPGTPEGTVRMRIRITYTGSVDPCGSTSYGEVEDYSINVVIPMFGTLSGYVTDPIVGPIQGARVFSGDYEAFTDATGFYQINEIIPGEYDFTCEADSYLTQVKNNIEVTANSAISLDFELEYAEIAIAPGSIEITLEPGEIYTTNLTISNPGGTGSLEWSSEINPVAKTAAKKQWSFFKNIPEVKAISNKTSRGQQKQQSNRNDLELLWDNTDINSTTSGIVSVNLTGITPDGRAITADDFEVPSSETWQVSYVYTEGFSTVATLPNAFGIEFYDDNGGRPGNMIYSESIIPADLNFDTQDLYLSNPVTLSGGTYWLSVYGIYNGSTNLTNTRWNWYTGTIPIGNEAALNDFSGLFGGPFGWEYLSELGVDDAPSAYFLIKGNKLPAVTWLSLNPTSGTVLPGENMDVEVTLNSADLDDGTYLASIDIDHNGREVTKGMVSIPISMTVISPKGKLSGLVFDENNQRLAGVKVTLENISAVTYTNALGRYNFEDVKTGFYDVSFEKANYLPKTFANIEVKRDAITELNVNMELMPPPSCPELVYPGIDEIVMPDITLQWEASAPYTATGYKLYLYNTSSDIWLEENTDIGNVTSYTPAEPFEIGSYYAWLLVPYNKAGETEGCEPWFFWVTPTGKLSGVVTDDVTGLPLENVEVFIQQMSGSYSTTIYTDADGAYDFEWMSGNYKVTFSKFAYTVQTFSPVVVNPYNITVLDVALEPFSTYSIPFFEGWNAGSFAAQQWTIVPEATNWSIYNYGGVYGNTARFYWSPNIFNYSHRLQSSLINGIGKDKVYAQFDFYLDNFSVSTVEKIIFEVFDGDVWHTVHTFTNQGGSIPWSAFNFDISQYAAGKVFQIGFTAEGENNYNINGIYIDNISLSSELMAVEPSAISDQLAVPATSQHPITITNLGSKALAWNAAGVPSWASLSASNGSIAGNGQQVVQLNLNSGAVPPGIYQAQITITGAGGLASEIIDIQLDVLDMVINPTSVSDKLQIGETSKWDIEISNPGPYLLDWNVNLVNKADWVFFDIESGILQVGETKPLKLTLDANQISSGQYTAEFLFTAADGLIEKTLTVSLVVYDMVISPEGLYDALYVNETSTYPLTITNTSLEDMIWSADLDEDWAELSALSGTLEAGESITLDFTFDATGITPDAYYSSMSFSAFDGELVKEVLIGLEVFDLDTDFQKIPVPTPNNWGFISAYINLNSKMTLEAALSNILDEMVILIGFDGFFWPSQNINTIGNWNLEKAYKLKMQKEGLLVFSGSEIENKELTLPAGTHLVPVLSSKPLSAADIFEGLDIEFAFSLDGLIYWPFGNIFTLETLNPGEGYLIRFNSETTLNFQNAKSSVNPNVVSIFENTTPWNDAYNTANVHLVGVSAKAASALQTGDFIGVFNSEGLCTGLTKYVNKDKAFLISVFGDDFTTDYIDGMKEGEYMTIKVFSNGEVVDVVPVYNTKLNNWDGLYAANGLSQITDLKMGATGIGANESAAIRIYPNPSTGLFNISGIDASYQVIVTNAQGQIIYNQKLISDMLDLTNQPTGVYFIKLIGNNQTTTQKVVIR